jgi:hypothetical protein
MTYVEELVDFPDGYFIKAPQFFLLATADAYFVYDATDGEDALLTTGETLEDVYKGMKDCRWADSCEDPWGFVEEEEYLSPTEYFPHYDRKENGNSRVWGTDMNCSMKKEYLTKSFSKKMGSVVQKNRSKK